MRTINMNLVKKISGTLLFIFYAVATIAQSSVDKTLASLQKQVAEQPFEKVYLHFDKPYYAAGDTLWFKGYTVAGAQHLPSDISGVLNVELINSNNYITSSIKLPIVSGLSYGDIVLPDTLTGGAYRIRAWTNWMRNAGPEYFFNHQLQIVNVIAEKATSKGKAKKNPSTPLDVQFLPEGGYLVNGAVAKVAFKATAANGLGKNIKGLVIDNKGDTIAPFESTHLGMGVFRFTPQEGSTYQAVITNGDVAAGTITLPAAKDKGYVLTASNTDSVNLSVKVTAVNEADGFTLVGQLGGQVFFRAKGQPGKVVSQVNIDKTKLPSGIVRLTLFSSTGEPMNERLVFIQNRDRLNLSIKTARQVYRTGEKVKVDLKIRDSNGQPATGSFSVSVINEDEVPVDEAAETTIFSHLLLTSDLRGYVEQPNYYFLNATAKTLADLDLLMLTQGYGRYEWKKVIDDKSTAIAYPPEKELAISGRVVKKGSKSLENYNVLLVGPPGFGIRSTVTDKDGTFTFHDLQFSDHTKFTIKASAPGDKDNSAVVVDSWPTTPVDVDHYLETRTDEDTSALKTYAKVSAISYEEDVKLGKRTKLLKDVNIKRQRIKTQREIEEEESTEFSANLNGRGKADQIFTTKDLEEFPGPDLFASLQGRINKVEVKGHVPFMIRPHAVMGQGAGKAMIVILDGTVLNPNPGGDNGRGGDPLAAIPPTMQIASVEILISPGHRAMYGNIGLGGVVIITSKMGPDKPKPISNANESGFMFNGYYKAHEFYSPVYNATRSEIPDFRTTIYWEPLLETDKNGNTSFQYFNASSKGNYRVVIEGIDNNGTLGRQVYRYRVQ